MLAKLVLGPVLIAQGMYVRAATPLLPEPAGERRGVSGAGPILRLLVLGDSAAAGVGVAHQTEALLGQLVATLAASFEVHWALIAKTGATSAKTLAHLDEAPTELFDVVVTSLGVNDVTSGRTCPQFLTDQAALLDQLQSKFGAGLVVVSGFPPVRFFPALPQPLRWYLGRECQRYDAALAEFVKSRRGCTYYAQPAETLTERGLSAKDVMASDGFHPGAPVYANWAGDVAVLIKERQNAQ
jgi:lysophospholipase L1-like esterase